MALFTMNRCISMMDENQLQVYKIFLKFIKEKCNHVDFQCFNFKTIILPKADLPVELQEPRRFFRHQDRTNMHHLTSYVI